MRQYQPNDFRTNRRYFGTFDNYETEMSALWLVRFCQHQGSWDPFKMADLQAFYGEKVSDQFTFNKLLDDASVVELNDGIVTIQLGFIAGLLKNESLQTTTEETS